MDLENPVSPDAETQNPAPETDVNPEAVTPETAPEETDQPGKDEADPRDKAVKSLTRRVDRVTAARYQAEARAQEAEKRAQEAMQRLAQYEQPQEQPNGPDPLTLAKEIARIERVTDKANTIAKDGAKRFDNFQTALQVIAKEAGPLFDQVGRPTGLGEACMSADDPAAVLHHIGSDPDLAAELADLTPIQQARRIARLEIELSKPKEPPRSNAPKPIAPVKAKASPEGLADELSTDEWMARRNAMVKRY
jgi:hypothetical protein